jgi:hypothetical protein
MQWKTKFPIQRLVGNGACYMLGAVYTMNVRDSAASPFYTDIATVYKNTAYLTVNQANVPSLACGSAALGAAFGVPAGSMTGYPDEVQGYPSNMQPAVAYSADWGGPLGVQAWTTFMSRTVKPDYAQGPQFGIVPRSIK